MSAIFGYIEQDIHQNYIWSNPAYPIMPQSQNRMSQYFSLFTVNKLFQWNFLVDLVAGMILTQCQNDRYYSLYMLAFV